MKTKQNKKSWMQDEIGVTDFNNDQLKSKEAAELREMGYSDQEIREIDEYWNEYEQSLLTTVLSEVEQEIKEHSQIESDGQPTNFGMYFNIRAKYKDLKKMGHKLEYPIIADTFKLEERTKLDLLNLNSFIIAMTLSGAQDILKAQAVGDKHLIELKSAEHKERCDLMMILTETIDSVIYTNFG